jgi:hypothetical protein
MKYLNGIIDSVRRGGIVKSGLILWLDAGNSTSYSGSGSTWYDLSGAGNNGTLINSPSYSTLGGGSLLFNGSNNYVSGNLQNSTTYTFNVWAYNLDNTTTSATVISSNGLPQTFIQIGGLPNHPWQYIYSFNTSPGATINQWVMLTGVQTTTNQQLYINGVKVINEIGTIQTSTLGTIYYLGRRSDGNYLNTYIGNAEIYNRALTDIEILQNFNALKTRYGL